MTQEDKDLLLKDLCARLPYGVKINIKSDYTREMEDTELTPYHLDGLGYDAEYRNLRPYLRPLNKIGRFEWLDLAEMGFAYDANTKLLKQLPFMDFNIDDVQYFIEFFNKHHIDYNNFIEKGLAIEAPEGMYNIK